MTVETKEIKKMNSPISWPGGKRLLANRIVEMFPEHTCYASAFAGALWDLFKKQLSECEVVNDINHDLINFYKVIKEKPYQFLLEMQWDLISRKAHFDYNADLKKDDLTDVERAKRFFYVLKTSFGSQGRTYGYVKTDHPKLNLVNIEEIIIATHNRLKRVNIECLDWREFIPKYDSLKTLFYLDPPYHCETSKRVYVQAFTDEDFKAFRDCLKGVKGMFLLSLNDDEFIRELFRDFTIEEVETLYTLSGSPKKAKEILIKNY
jgi:DNA adenine methylase